MELELYIACPICREARATGEWVECVSCGDSGEAHGMPTTRMYHWIPEPRSMPRQLREGKISYEEGAFTSVTEADQISLSACEHYNGKQAGWGQEPAFCSISMLAAWIGAVAVCDYIPGSMLITA